MTPVFFVSRFSFLLLFLRRLPLPLVLFIGLISLFGIYYRVPRFVLSGFDILDFSSSVSFRVLVAFISYGKFSDITSWTLLFSNSLLFLQLLRILNHFPLLIGHCIVSACLCSIPCFLVHISLFICSSLFLIALLRLLLQIPPFFLEVLFNYFSNVPIFPCVTFFFQISSLMSLVFSSIFCHASENIFLSNVDFWKWGLTLLLWPSIDLLYQKFFLSRILHPMEFYVVSVCGAIPAGGWVCFL